MNVTPFDLQPHAARFLQTGGDLATLQTVLGHSNLSTTARYLHPDAGRVQEMVEEL
jgi:site-specific recombinase XerD